MKESIQGHLQVGGRDGAFGSDRRAALGRLLDRGGRDLLGLGLEVAGEVDVVALEYGGLAGLARAALAYENHASFDLVGPDDPVRDAECLTEAVFGTTARPAVMPMDAYRDQDTVVYTDGVLTLRIPVAEQAKPRKIEIS